jgi:hypothetical protein
MRLRVVLFLPPAVASIVCPDETWRKVLDKCYRKIGSCGTHAECAAMCGANASLPHITSLVENDAVAWVAGGESAWIGLHKKMVPDNPRAPGFWIAWTSGQDATTGLFRNWAQNFPMDYCGAANCAVIVPDGTWTDNACAWHLESETLVGPKPTCVCEYPAHTTQEYWDAVPQLEEECDPAVAAQRKAVNIVFVCGLVFTEVVWWWRSRKTQRSMVHRTEVAPASDEEKAEDGGSTAHREPTLTTGAAYLGRRQSLNATHQHGKLLEEKASDTEDDALRSLQIKHMGVVMVMAGIRAPKCLRQPRMDASVPVISRVLACWYLLASAEFFWSLGSPTYKLGAVCCVWMALTLWCVHVTMTSVFVDEPAHLLFVIEPIKQDEEAWKALRAKLNPTVTLVVVFLVAAMIGVRNARPGTAGYNLFGNAPLGAVFTFAGWSVFLSTIFMPFVICLRLLTAGHARLLIDLEQRIVKLLHETERDDPHAFCLGMDTAERRVTGAMGTSNGKLGPAIWLTLTMIGLGIITLLACIKAWWSLSQSAMQGQLVAFAIILIIAFWGLCALLNLLRSVGDALSDLVEEMNKAHNCSRVAALLDDPSFLVRRFTDWHTARKLTWVLLTDPVTSVTVHKAIVGVLLSAAFVFLPALLAEIA